MGIKTRFHQKNNLEYAIRVITYRKKRRYYYNCILKKTGKGIIYVVCKFNGYYLLSFHADITNTEKPDVKYDDNDVDQIITWVIFEALHYYEFAYYEMKEHILNILIKDNHFSNWR